MSPLTTKQAIYKFVKTPMVGGPWEQIRKRTASNSANLTFSGADFTDANLKNASFAGANVSEGIFEGADLTGADFTDARLHSATLKGAIIEGTDFTRANLTFASLRRTEGDAIYCNTIMPNGDTNDEDC